MSQMNDRENLSKEKSDIQHKEREFYNKKYANVDYDDCYSVVNRDIIEYWTDGFFSKSLGDTDGKDILVIGGGIDMIGLSMAENGANVTSLDLSTTASEITLKLAKEMYLEEKMSIRSISCESMQFEGIFDIVIAPYSIHHIDIGIAMANIRESLKPGGFLLAVEPCCLSPILHWIHKKFPFHPFYDVTEDEIEIGKRELTIIRSCFSEMEVTYFELFSRAFAIYFLKRLNMGGIEPSLRRFDRILLDNAPILRYFAAHLMIKASK